MSLQDHLQDLNFLFQKTDFSGFYLRNVEYCLFFKKKKKQTPPLEFLQKEASLKDGFIPNHVCHVLSM